MVDNRGRNNGKDPDKEVGDIWAWVYLRTITLRDKGKEFGLNLLIMEDTITPEDSEAAADNLFEQIQQMNTW